MLNRTKTWKEGKKEGNVGERHSRRKILFPTLFSFSSFKTRDFIKHFIVNVNVLDLDRL